MVDGAFMNRVVLVGRILRNAVLVDDRIGGGGVIPKSFS